MDGFEYAFVGLRLSYHEQVVLPDGTAEVVEQGAGEQLVTSWTQAWETAQRHRFETEVLPAERADFERRTVAWEALRDEREAAFRNWRAQVRITDLEVDLPAPSGVLRRRRHERGKRIDFPDAAPVEIHPRLDADGRVGYAVLQADFPVRPGRPSPSEESAEPGSSASEARHARSARVYLPDDLTVVSLSSFEVERVIRRVFDAGHPLSNKPVEATPDPQEWLAAQRAALPEPEIRQAPGWSGVIRYEHDREPVGLVLGGADFGVPEDLVVGLLSRLGRQGWEVVSVTEDKALSAPSRVRILLGRVRR